MNKLFCQILLPETQNIQTRKPPVDDLQSEGVKPSNRRQRSRPNQGSLALSLPANRGELLAWLSLPHVARLNRGGEVRYKNWTQFLDERCAALRTNRRAASLDMGFSAGYLEGIEKGRFSASRERCLKIAKYFGVDPNEVLALAGLYVTPAETPSIVEEIVSEASGLSTLGQRLVLQILCLARAGVRVASPECHFLLLHPAKSSDTSTSLDFSPFPRMWRYHFPLVRDTSSASSPIGNNRSVRALRN